jgi:hypothetical protein
MLTQLTGSTGIRKKNRNWRAKLRSASVLAVFACTIAYAQDVRTNYMPGTDFSKYHNYAWVDEVQGVPLVGARPDQIMDAQVKQAIDSQMSAKGFTKVVEASKADLLLGYQLKIDQEKQVNGFGDNLGGWGGLGGWGTWGGSSFGSFSAATSTNYMGMWVVGIYDPAVKKLVWIGVAQHAIEPSKKQEKNVERLNKGAQKLLKNFPPGPGK